MIDQIDIQKILKNIESTFKGNNNEHIAT